MQATKFCCTLQQHLCMNGTPAKSHNTLNVVNSLHRTSNVCEQKEANKTNLKESLLLAVADVSQS